MIGGYSQEISRTRMYRRQTLPCALLDVRPPAVERSSADGVPEPKSG